MKKFFASLPGVGRSRGILEVGEKWRLVRMFLQTDILSPQSAARYLPHIVEAVPFISRGIPDRNPNDFMSFLNRASFDMFYPVLLGQFVHLTDPEIESKPEDVVFCESVARALKLNNRLTHSLVQKLARDVGYETALYREFATNWRQAIDVAVEKVQRLREKKQAGELTPFEEDSYWNQSHLRRINENSDLTEQEVDYICYIMLSAAVDTTSGKTAWHIMHAALSEEAQEKLRTEVLENVSQTDGKLHPDHLSSTNAPYMHAFLRESHRLTNPSNLVPMRKIASELEVHGVTFPAGTMFAFDSISKSMSLVDDPEDFRPERWFPDAVQARKGAPAEALDHPLFGSPIGQGARRCPGSRVARNESMALLAQLVLDWNISIPGYSHRREIPYELMTVTAPRLPPLEFVPRQ